VSRKDGEAGEISAYPLNDGHQAQTVTKKQHLVGRDRRKRISSLGRNVKTRAVPLATREIGQATDATMERC